MGIEGRFTATAVSALRDAIADAGGNEVFFLGTLDREGRIDGARVLARGNRDAAPAIMHVPRPGEVVLHNHPSGALSPSGADLEVASRLGNDGIGFLIVDNQVTQAYVVVEPHRKPETARLDVEKALDLLRPNGAVASVLGDYECRDEQLQMLARVAAAFNDDAVLSVEAGTGTGKSFAYLIPSILWSRANKERVIVSTHTINLQEQLVRKDLPLLLERAGLECTPVLVKGRGNYLCQRKAVQAAAQPELVEDDLQNELGQILAWSKKTKDGSLTDLPFAPRPGVWEQVVSENDNCLRARCPYYSTCFFYGARRAAAAADLLIVNHHLLLADVALRDQIDEYAQNAVLPPAQRIVIDEAHHLEEVATSFFSARVSLLAIERALNRLQSRRRGERGILPALRTALQAIDDPVAAPIARGAAALVGERLLLQRDGLQQAAGEAFLELTIGFENLLEQAAGARVDAASAAVPARKVRVTHELLQTPYWRDVERALSRLAASLSHYADGLAAVTDRLERIENDVARQVLFLGTELRAVQNRIGALGLTLTRFLDDDPSLCRWIETAETRTGPSIVFRTAPIEPGPLLRRALFERFPTVAMTSATLAVDGRFDYQHARVGADSLSVPERVETLLVPSPFDYARQALLAVPADLPEPTEPGFPEAAHAFLARLLHVTAGGTFLLFTSYAALTRAWDALANEMSAAGLHPLRQGQMNRSLLLEQFKQDRGGVLFATDSFWEGVDVRGDALRCVVIARLPFQVPTEPVQQARHEVARARGGNPFAELTLPQAVLKLKQGFGRLIRSRTDRGAVVILDSRVAHRRYGDTFLRSLPPARRVVASSDTVLEEIRGFMAKSRAAART